MLSEWNKFVSKVYQEGKKKNSNYKFKDALRDASARKGEMGKSGPGMGSVGSKSSRKSCVKKCNECLSPFTLLHHPYNCAGHRPDFIRRCVDLQH
jgi:hypothetical protein